MPSTPVARRLSTLRRDLTLLRKNGSTIALVPPMGALHEGHISLVRLARRRATKVVVSIFVNPTQFGPTEDFASYPRTWDADLAKLTAAGVDLVWNPSKEVIYPSGFSTRVDLAGPAIAGLEDRFRPDFFSGVATVVAKLFLQCQPDLAIFGEKDFQQLRVVQQMARDLDLGVRVVGSATIRDSDGLAKSSRNVYLSADERKVACSLYLAMSETGRRIRAGEDFGSVMAAGTRAIEANGFSVDYFELRDSESLSPVTSTHPVTRLRILTAARLGTTRLIDNIPV